MYTMYIDAKYPAIMRGIKWEHTGSNRGPSACKADALNQLSYAPFYRSAKIRAKAFPPKFF